MNITAAQVNELRQITGAGMMDCKKALVECNGDQKAAIDYLRQKGQKINTQNHSNQQSNKHYSGFFGVLLNVFLFKVFNLCFLLL